MRKYQGYKIAVWILCLVILIQGIFIIVLSRPKKIEKIPRVLKGRIAIVIDDWGYNLHNLSVLEQIKYPLTIAVLPNLNYSQTVAKQAKRLGFEIILHLPMEPHEKYRLEKDTILTTMKEPQIKRILTQDLANIAYAKGVSNHMGSRATEDLKIMEVTFRELRKNKLYFLDSLVSAQSICFDLARKMHLGFAQRDIFLDNTEEPEYIKAQIYKLKAKASLYGEAVGIGHDRRVTLEVLKEVMPELKKQGYKFVFVSELIK